MKTCDQWIDQNDNIDIIGGCLPADSNVVVHARWHLLADSIGGYLSADSNVVVRAFIINDVLIKCDLAGVLRCF